MRYRLYKIRAYIALALHDAGVNRIGYIIIKTKIFQPFSPEKDMKNLL